MKATWATSLLTGIISGGVIFISELSGKADMAFVLPVFFAGAFLGVIGLGQIRSMNAERKKRGLGVFGIMASPEDFSRYYFPAWGRMFLWFLATVVTLFTLKALLA
jgi:hypothetical protein